MGTRIKNTRSMHVAETKVSPLAVEGVDAQESEIEENEAGHVIGTGRGGVDRVTGIVDGAGAVLVKGGTGEINEGATHLVPRNARQRHSRRRSVKCRRRKRGRE